MCAKNGCNSIMDSHQNLPVFLSPKQLLEELESLLSIESSRNTSPWVSLARLSELFREKHGSSLEEVAQAEGYSDSLRSLLRSCRRFSIYGTQMPQGYYIALLTEVVHNYDPNQTKPIQCRIKRSWKVDGGLPRILKAEGVEKNPPRKSQTILKHQPILTPEIKSVEALEAVLMEIIKSLTNSEQSVTVATLSKKFRGHYGQAIRPVVRSVCPDMRLIDLLQTIPNLHVQEIDNDWRITLKADSIE
jgi:hypothetical protein